MFASDNYLSPKHASLTVRNGSLFVQDAGSLNGTYLRLKPNDPELIADGQMFRIGQEIIRFDRLKPQPAQDGVEFMGSPPDGYIGRITLVTGRNSEGNAFPVPETGIQLGRERGHVLFPEDGYVSGLHCSLAQVEGQMMLTDLESSNGSFVRLNAERELHEGDVLLMGQQLFRVAV
jgi:pSer/pThr/pTyr-binding forkhead associated (FHA) protein